MKKHEDMTIEEKVDLILKYQTRLHHLAIARAIFSFLIFLLLVLLPILGFYYVADYFQQQVGMNFTEIQAMIKSGGLEQLMKFIK